MDWKIILLSLSMLVFDSEVQPNSGFKRVIKYFSLVKSLLEAGVL